GGASRRGPREGLRAGLRDRRRKRRRCGVPGGPQLDREGARGRRACADRGKDLPAQRTFPRRPGKGPASGRARGRDEARSDRALPQAAARAGLRGGSAAGAGEGRPGRGGRGDRGGQGVAARSSGGDRARRLGGRRLVVAELTYREAVAAGVAQEMERDERVVFLGEDVGAAGGGFKSTLGLLPRVGPPRGRGTPLPPHASISPALG